MNAAGATANAAHRSGTGLAPPRCPRMSTDSPRGILTEIGTWTSRPTAFLIVVAYAAAMALIAPEEINWHSVATLITWLMTLFIQRAEHRDTQALHAKLDELLRANGKARDQLTDLDDKEPEQVEAFRDKARASSSPDRPA